MFVFGRAGNSGSDLRRSRKTSARGITVSRVPSHQTVVVTGPPMVDRFRLFNSYIKT